MPGNELAGLSILLTRPAGQAEAWAAELTRLGAEVTHIPSLQIEALPKPAKLEADLGACDIGIFVSSNAVMALSSLLTDQRLKQKIRWYGVGQKTQQTAAEEGFRLITAEAYNSETLLQHADLQSVAGQSCSIIRGLGGRPDLARVLAERGAEVKLCELYRRACAWQNSATLASYLAAQASTKEGELIISATSVDNLNYTFLLAEKAEMAGNITRATFLVPGERVALAARQLGLNQIVLARSARLADIVYSLKSWWAERQ